MIIKEVLIQEYFPLFQSLYQELSPGINFLVDPAGW